jgi:hypothetical protein
MKKLLPIVVIAVGSALGVTGCGTVHATSGSPAGAQQAAPASSPIDAARVTPAFGWVLTADRLLLTKDGGATFTDAKVPVPPGQGRAAYFSDVLNGYVAAPVAGMIMTARTSDGGRTWHIGTVRDPSAPGMDYGPLRLTFGDVTHGAILAQTSTSMTTSTATMFATANGGTSWSAHRAPTAGEISMEPGGRTWLAGGAAGDQLHVSRDDGSHWSSVKLDLGGDVAGKTVATPHDGVLPVTVVNKADQTEVAFLTTADQGRTWRETRRVPVQGKTGPNVRVPVATAEGDQLVMDTVGGHAYRLNARGVAPATAAAPDVRPSGLPEGVHTVTFAPGGRSGWALATYGKCAEGKNDCTLYNPLLTTDDGGVTWRQLRMWQQRLN